MNWIVLTLSVLIIILVGNYFAKTLFKEKGREPIDDMDDIYPMY